MKRIIEILLLQQQQSLYCKLWSYDYTLEQIEKLSRIKSNRISE